jgi:hypothetical protein
LISQSFNRPSASEEEDPDDPLEDELDEECFRVDLEETFLTFFVLDQE